MSHNKLNGGKYLSVFLSKYLLQQSYKNKILITIVTLYKSFYFIEALK